MGNKINFFKGEKEKYTATDTVGSKNIYGVDKDNDIYFATDTKEILMGDDVYGSTDSFNTQLTTNISDASTYDDNDEKETFAFNNILSLQGISLKKKSNSLQIGGGIKYIDARTFSNSNFPDGVNNWNVGKKTVSNNTTETKELCYTLFPVAVKNDYDTDKDGKVGIEEILFLIAIILRNIDVLDVKVKTKYLNAYAKLLDEIDLLLGEGSSDSNTFNLTPGLESRITKQDLIDDINNTLHTNFSYDIPAIGENSMNVIYKLWYSAVKADKIVDVNNDNNVDVMDITRLIDIIMGETEIPIVSLGYDLIFFEVSGVYGNMDNDGNYAITKFVKEDLGKIFVSDETVAELIDKELMLLGLKPETDDDDEDENLNPSPTKGIMRAPTGVQFTKAPIEEGDEEEVDPEDPETYVLETDFTYSSYFNLPYTFEFTEIDLQDPTSWIGTISDNEILDYLLGTDELPTEGLSLSFVDSYNYSTFHEELLSSILTKELTRVKYNTGTSDIEVFFIACHFNLIIPDVNLSGYDDKRACLILAKITGLPLNIADGSVYAWAIGTEGQNTNPTKDAFTKLITEYGIDQMI